MKTIQSQDHNKELRKALETIVHDLEESKVYAGKFLIERILPPTGTPTDKPAGLSSSDGSGENPDESAGAISTEIHKDIICCQRRIL